MFGLGRHLVKWQNRDSEMKKLVKCYIAVVARIREGKRIRVWGGEGGRSGQRVGEFGRGVVKGQDGGGASRRVWWKNNT